MSRKHRNQRSGHVMLEQPRPEPPFTVIMAGFVVDLHNRATCPRCQPDGCPKLRAAGLILKVWRARKPHEDR